MTTLLGLFMLVLAVLVATMVVVQSRRGTVDLFSVRNFFLLGFIVFQITSATITFWTGYYDALVCSDYGKVGLVYTLVLLLWLSFYLIFYAKNKPAVFLASRLRSSHGATTPTMMLVLASSFLLAAIFCRFALATVPVVGVLAIILATGLSGAAAGMASWVWAPRPFRPMIALAAGSIILVALGVVLYQAFGRRDALSVIIACVWGAHHGHWKHIGLKRAAKQIVPLGAAGLLFMAAFSGARTEKDYSLGVIESVTRVTQGKLGDGLLAMASGQAAAACSMWIIDTRPQSFEYDTLHTFRYFIGHPIPRIFWENKPIALGWAMTSQGKVRGRSKGFNFGPGLMGHVYNDNPWISLVPYAFGLAFLMRFMDQLAKLNPTNPFIVVPLGCALGDLLALPRGETGLFLSRAVLMMVGSFMGMTFCAGVLSTLGLRAPAAESEDDLSAGEEAAPAGSELIDAEVAAAYGVEDA